MSESQIKILNSWYETLDREYGQHGDPDSSCPICIDAYNLNLLEEAPLAND